MRKREKTKKEKLKTTKKRCRSTTKESRNIPNITADQKGKKK